MNILIPLKEYVDLHEDEFFKRFMYSYSLLESLRCHNNLDEIIDEVHGSYDNQLDIVLLFSKYIVGLVLKKKEKLSYVNNCTIIFYKNKIESAFEKIKNIHIKNIFFEKIIIKISNDENEYEVKNNLNKNGLLDEVTINLNKNDDLSNIENVIIIFYHELLHAYDNWKRQINKSKTFNDKLKEFNYDSWINKKGLSKDNEDDLIHGMIKELLYMTNQIERNAFVTELHSIVAKWKLNKIYPSYAKAIKNFKSTGQWKSLEDLDVILSIDDKEINDKIVKWYNIESTKELSYNKALSKIRFLIDKCKRKYEELAPKIYFDYIETNNKELEELTESKESLNRKNLLRSMDCLLVYNNLKLNNYECITFD